MPSAVAPDPLLHAVLASAADATQAANGWLFALRGDQLCVVAECGVAAPSRIGRRGPRQFGWAGAVISTGQPVAMAPGPDDPRFSGDLVADPSSRPSSLLCFPCRYQNATVGALQLQDKAGQAPFILDDVELIGHLAEVAGAAIADAAASGGAAPPSPEDLGADLEHLAAVDPQRYRTIAGMVNALLGGA